VGPRTTGSSVHRVWSEDAREVQRFAQCRLPSACVEFYYECVSINVIKILMIKKYVNDVSFCFLTIYKKDMFYCFILYFIKIKQCLIQVIFIIIVQYQDIDSDLW